jgi:TP901 family phage tail tape measure protein
MAFEIFSIVGKIGLEGSDKVNTQLGLLQGESEKTKAAMSKVGTGMAVMGGAILGGMGLAMKSAADFETAMREVNTMMNLSSQQFKELSGEVQALASDMGVDAVDSAKALYQAISAGVPKDNAVEFLRIATKAAIGGVTSTATAVDGLTTVLNAFKMPVSEAEQVADIMFTTVKGGKTTMEELSQSLFNVAPIAAASGVKFEEVSAALSTMTKQGIPTTIATTSLRQALVTMQKPTADMAVAIKSLGYETGQSMLDSLGLAEAFNQLRGYTKGSNEMLMKMLGSVEAGQAVLSLTGDSAQMFADDLAAMSKAAGASDAAFQEMEKSTARQMEHLQAAFKDIQITIGNVLLPGLTALLGVIKPIVQAMTDWTSAHPGLTKVIVIATTALGGLLVVGGLILITLSKLAGAWATLTLVMKSNTVAMVRYRTAAIAARIATSTLYTSLGLIGVALGVAAVAFEVFSGKSKKAKEEVKETAEEVDNLSERLIQMAKKLTSGSILSQKELGDLKEAIKKATTTEELEQYNTILEVSAENVENLAGQIEEQGGSAHATGWYVSELAKASEELAQRQAELTGVVDLATIAEKQHQDAVDFANDAITIQEQALDMAKNALEGYKEMASDASEEVSRLKGELQSANDELNSLTNPNLEGMGEFKNQIADIDLELANLELKKIQEFGAGSAGETELGAAKKKLAELQESQKASDLPSAFDSDILAAEADIKAIEDRASAIDRDIELQRTLRRELELTRDITFEPQIRELEDLGDKYNETGIYGEQSFNAVRDRMNELTDTVIPDLKTQLEDAETYLDWTTSLVTLHTSVVATMTQMVIDSKVQLDALEADFAGTALAIKAQASDAAAAWANVIAMKTAANGGSSITAPSVSTPNISPANQALGGITMSPGLSWVGEQGPELLNLPTGAIVRPLDKIGSPSVSVNVNVYGSVTTERDLVDIIMSQAIPQIRNAIGAR